MYWACILLDTLWMDSYICYNTFMFRK